ncbi:MAG: TIGR03936 family radical SAM-associated protein [Gemmataceae bacterium]
MVRDKVRIRFRKTGALRLVSHHDLMRCFERMLRRAELPFRSTEGFNPKPRLVFALSLALGIIGCQEVVELELTEQLPVEDIHARLARQAPAGLEILSVRRVDPRAQAQARRVIYRLPLSTEQQVGLPERLAALLRTDAYWVERVHPRPSRRDIRPYVRDLWLHDHHLYMDIAITPTGSARPEEVARWLGLEDTLLAGAVWERILLELHDEVGTAADSTVPALVTGGDA